MSDPRKNDRDCLVIDGNLGGAEVYDAGWQTNRGESIARVGADTGGGTECGTAKHDLNRGVQS